MSKPRFSDAEILMHRAARADLPPAQQANLDALQARLTALFAQYPKPLTVSSGYRPPALNAAAGGAAQSWHMQCAALDVQDLDGAVWQYCMQHLQQCADLGLWVEDKRWTPTWVHLQIYPPKSGSRVFRPNDKAPLDAGLWNGIYDKNLDSKDIVKIDKGETKP